MSHDAMLQGMAPRRRGSERQWILPARGCASGRSCSALSTTSGGSLGVIYHLYFHQTRRQQHVLHHAAVFWRAAHQHIRKDFRTRFKRMMCRYKDASNLRDRLIELQSQADVSKAAASEAAGSSELDYQLGQRVLHSQLGYRGVICG